MRIKKIFCSILALVLCVMSVPFVSLAAGSTSIDVSNESPAVGDTFNVTVSATETGQMTIKYDTGVLSLIGSSVDGGQSSGSITVNGSNVVLTFSAKSQGTSGVIVSSPSLAGSSVNISVSGGGTQTQGDTQGDGTTENTTETNVSPGDVDLTIDGVLYTPSERYSDSEIPAGFYSVTLEINGGTYKEISNGGVILCYLKPADNTAGPGEFYVYDENSGSFSEFYMLGNPQNYVILKTPDKPLINGMTSTNYTVSDKAFPMYSLADAPSEFYYVYGVNEQLYEGWFMYDSLSQTVSRADTAALTLLDRPVVEDKTQETEPKDSGSGSSFSFSPKVIMIGAAIFLGLLVIILIINLILKRRERDGYYDDDYDDEDYDDYEDEEVIETVKEIKSAPVIPEALKVNKAEEMADFTAPIKDSKPVVKMETPPVVKREEEIDEAENYTRSLAQSGAFDPPQKETLKEDSFFQDEERREVKRPQTDDEVIDDIIKRVTANSNMDIMDLDDM